MTLRIVALLAALSAAGELNAQIMEDSTVQVVAYWSVGDSFSYRCEKTRYRVADGDTTLVSTHIDRLDMAVEEAADDGYRLRVRSTALYDSDPAKRELQGKMSEMFENRGNVLVTDELGTIKNVVLTDEDIALYRRQAEFAADYTYENIVDDDYREIVDKESFCNKLVEATSGVNTLTLAVLGDAAPLLAYHGGRFEADREYNYNTSLPSLLDSDTAIPANATFWIDEIEYDAGIVYMQQHIVADPAAVMADAVNLALDLSGEEERLNSTSVDWKSVMEVTQFTVIDIDSGWPLAFGECKVLDADGKIAVVMNRTISMITDEE